MISKRAAETKLIEVDFGPDFNSVDYLTGTPTAAEVGTSDLTIGTVSIEDLPFGTYPIRPAGVCVCPSTEQQPGKASFLVSGGTAGNEYTIRVTAASNEGQSLIRDVRLRVN